MMIIMVLYLTSATGTTNPRSPVEKICQPIHTYISHHPSPCASPKEKSDYRITSLCSDCKWRNCIMLKIYSSYASNGNQDKCAQ
jgi:hypothetical protein